MTKALVIIDVQNAILEGKGTPERQPLLDAALDVMIGRLKVLQQRARAAGVPVIVVQHDDPPGQRLAVGTPGWELRPEIAPVSGDMLVRKTACDAFFETDLAGLLNAHGLTQVVVGGCMTQFCIDTTVRRAISLGYDVTLVADGHMTADLGALTFDQIIEHHNATLDGFDAADRSVTIRPASDVVF